MQNIIDDFYFLSELLDDDYDIIIDFMKDKTNTIKSKSIIKRCIENASYDLIKDEIDLCLDIKTNCFKTYKIKWYSLHQNDTLFEDLT